MVTNDEDQLPRSVNEPPFQALTPNLDRLSRTSLRPGTLSRRKIIRSGVALAALLLGAVGAIACAIQLS